MAVQRDEKGRVKAGSKLNEIHSLEELLVKFRELSDKCINGGYLSMQECQMNSGLVPSTFYDVADKHPQLVDLKRQMNDAIIANVNKKALKGDFNATASIWRMKNLGEKDKQEIDIINREQRLFPLD